MRKNSVRCTRLQQQPSESGITFIEPSSTWSRTRRSVSLEITVDEAAQSNPSLLFGEVQGIRFYQEVSPDYLKALFCMLPIFPLKLKLGLQFRKKL
ncbi:hypothetical protein [Flavivirga jejuensis]|uniref:Uncharacterized protein n=1 Tax=Flavivirga jejuensis TaxID=870487 RepID=A0ABT8WJS6_9FLAO|nr:hypothetical protein [Flavivirga jejuensis]MDO5973416.1 hypothetical protein [Flavivirga jejuensis]